MFVMTQSRGSETVSIPTLSEILRADPQAFVEKYDDIAAINLACAVGLPRRETLDIAKSLKALDAMATWIKRRTAGSWSIYERDPALFDGSKNLFRIILMIRFLHVQFRVRYNPLRVDRSDHSYDPKDVDDHFICGILSEKRMGTCATLPVFAVAIGRRLGYLLKLVKVPDHLLFRWEDEHERFNVEYNGETGNVYPDEHYYERPVRWTAEVRARQPFARWLISNSREEEVAGFLGLRALVLDAYHRTGEALQCIDAAQRFNPIAAPLYDEARVTFIAGFAQRMSPDPRGRPTAITPYLIQSLLPTVPLHPGLIDRSNR